MTEELKKPEVTIPALLEGLKANPEQKTIRTPSLVRPETFEGRRAGETHAFTKKRLKNRARNKMAKASRRKR